MEYLRNKISYYFSQPNNQNKELLNKISLLETENIKLKEKNTGLNSLINANNILLSLLEKENIKLKEKNTELNCLININSIQSINSNLYNK